MAAKIIHVKIVIEDSDPKSPLAKTVCVRGELHPHGWNIEGVVFPKHFAMLHQISHAIRVAEKGEGAEIQ